MMTATATPAQTIDIRLPKRHPAQLAIDKTSARWNIMRCGRRFGKDILTARRTIVRSASLRYQGWFAPTYRMMEQNYEDVHKRLAPIVSRASSADHVIETVNGSVIDFWSLEAFESARGRKYNWVVINEAAQFKNLKLAWESVIRPTLADYKGGVDISSTPRGLNFMYELEQQFKTLPDGRISHYTTFDNPYIDRDEIEAMRLVMPAQVYKQEILAEYVQDGTFFENVEDVCVIDAPDVPANHAGHQFVAGLDWARSGDFTSLCIGCVECARAVDWWSSTGLPFTAQRAMIKQRLAPWANVRLLPERNSIGMPNVELLAEDGLNIEAGPDGKLGFYTTSISKVDLITRAHQIVAKKEFLLPRAHAPQFLAYEMEITSGNPRFNAPVGQHDDDVIADALMLRVAAVPIQIFI